MKSYSHTNYINIIHQTGPATNRLLNIACLIWSLLVILKMVNDLNIRSLLPELDYIKTWAMPDSLCRTFWISGDILDSDINIEGYNVFRADRQGRGRGVAILIN